MARQKLIGITALVAIVAVAGVYILLSSPGQPVAQTMDETIEAQAPDTGINLESALAERALGNPDAPVTIEEFASLTCGHCARFYEETFIQLKEAYIDTGKVRFIYTDYPLNAPAFDAAVIARCLPEERYFKFIKFLFGSQEDWAYTAGYQKALKQNAKLLGATEEGLKSCLNNQELRQGLAARMQKASIDHEIKATPSFVVNGTEVIRGGQNFDAFQKIIGKLLEESKATK